MKKYGLHLVRVIVLIVASTFGVKYLLDKMFVFPIGASAEAVPIAELFNAHFWVIAALFSLVVVFLLYSVIVFRRREGDEGDGDYMHGNTALEIAWTIAPLAIVVVFAIWGSNSLIEITEAKDDEMIVEVSARKWAWSFYYPELGMGSNDLYLPLDRPVLLKMKSEDILHSFWVPEFRVKQDVLPSERELRFTPSMVTAPGEPFKVRCAEICGTSHAYMLADVHVLESQEAFEEQVNLANQLPQTALERGEKWYVDYACEGCHSVDGTLENYSGPSWLGIYGREEALTDGTVAIVDDEYIRESIYDPNVKIVEGYAAGVMTQTFEQDFAAKEAEIQSELGLDIDMVSDLIEFMKTLEE